MNRIYAKLFAAALAICAIAPASAQTPVTVSAWGTPVTIVGGGKPNGPAMLDGSGSVTAPSVTVLTLPETGGTVSPSDTDTTLYTLTPSAAGTVTFGPGVGAGHQKIIELLIVQSASSGVPIELSGPISWPNGAAPIVSSMPGDRTFIRFLTTDGGQTYIGGI